MESTRGALPQWKAPPVEPAAADYLMQVAFSELPKGVGVMRDGAGSWLSEARRRFGLRRTAYAVSITAIEAKTGKAA